ncbi:ATV_HP_G0159040.mRNA.1.CDS.1 [Saccharomyces cerevisiae]|nr:ATV_HP_G0159040.mRNA.1.CDS.1 [Saccharomyces cerevisiae]CAI6938377.1 ATV_HP_G0159040.mRNA.1.CDS.1 [Saccharomyces cerevisiae]
MDCQIQESKTFFYGSTCYLQLLVTSSSSARITWKSLQPVIVFDAGLILTKLLSSVKALGFWDLNSNISAWKWMYEFSGKWSPT